ncbi:MAG: Ig-like domain-containing protein [Bacteroidetes bacterium]|nr:Ig-like domain-containing protein [Bacteroidota bacterium]
MASIVKAKKIIVRFIILIFIISGCANPQPPSGGPPDKTPPEIISYEPANGTLNFKGNSITIEFNKYMNKNEVNDNVFISPNVLFNLDWSGKELEIKLREELSPNTTYALTLGTEYSDTRQNKPAEAFSLIFSTGNVIDSGIVRGRLYGKDPSGVFIFCYKIDSINADTLNPSHTKPYSRIQVGSNGNFEFHALKDGLYRFFAVRDKFKDGIYDNGMDDFGAAPNDVLLRQDSASNINLKIGTAIDKAGPILNNAEAISNRRLILEFNENIDTLSVDKSLFEISDSTKKYDFGIESANISSKDGNYVELFSKNELDTSIKWFVTVKGGLKDSAGNFISDSNNRTYFYSLAEQDTIEPKIIKQPFKDSTFNVSPEQSFDFIFNIAMQQGILDKIKFRMPEGSKEIPFDAYWKDGNHLSISPKQILQSDSWYSLSVDLREFKGTNGLGMSDSIIRLKFKTKDIRNYGGISGSLKGNYQSGEKYIITLISKDKSQTYSSKADSSGIWKFNLIPPGYYTIEVYIDKDGNGKYSYGVSYPFKFSEKFYVFDKEFEIKPRWKVEDVIIELPD